MNSLDLLGEQARKYHRQLGFLRYELRYALLRSQKATDEEAFRTILESRVRLLLETVERIDRDVNKAFSAPDVVFRIPGIERSISGLAPVLDCLTHAIVQRRLKPSRARSPADAGHRFPLNECHPAYADFYRGVEHTTQETISKLLPSYFAKLRDMPGAPHTFTPLLVVSKEPWFRQQMYGIQKDGRGRPRFHDHARRLFLLSFMAIPRHSPATLFLVPAVAHESAHFVTEILRHAIVSVLDPKTGSLKGIRLGKNLIDKLAETYGLPYPTLVDQTARLVESYECLLREVAQSHAAPAAFSEGVRHHLANSEVIASRQVAEMVCDFLGVVLAGPAFALSFLKSSLLIDGFWSHRGEAAFRHPPTQLRARLQVEALRQLGFGQMAAGMEDSLKALRPKLSPGMASLDDVCARWVAAVSGDHVAEIVRSMRMHVVASPAELLSFESDEVRVVRENRWRDCLLELAQEVEAGIALTDPSVSCMDLFNAWWLSYVERKSDRIRSTLPWLLCLRNARPVMAWKLDAM